MDQRYFGDNLDILCEHIPDASVDLSQGGLSFKKAKQEKPVGEQQLLS